MITVYRREDRNNEWWINFNYTDPKGARKRFRRRADVQSKKGAYEWAQQQLARLTAPQEPEPAEVPTLATYAEEYMRTYSVTHHKPSVRATYADILRLHLLPELGDAQLDAISARDVDRYCASKAEDELAAKTIKNHLALLSAMLRVAWRWGIIASVPHIEMPRVEPPEWSWLRDDEIERLLVASQGERRLKTLVPVALYTGLRVGEQLALTWGDVDLERGELHVRRSYASGETTSPKSNKHRTIPLHEVAIEALRAQRLETILRGDLVWCDDDGAQLTKQHIRDPFSRVVKRAGVRTIRWHDLRHTFASRLVSAGASLSAIQLLLGHSDVRTTMRYAHLAQSDLSQAVELLGTRRVPKEAADG